MRLGVTPVPIPNTMVKTYAAENTMLETTWEDRWLPNSWGRSSVGRAPALQAGGQEFESLRLHRKILANFALRILKSFSNGFMILKVRIYEIVTGLIAQPVRAHA